MKQKVTFMLLAMLFCCVLGIHAQTGGQVSGKVVDAMGELPGVSVVVKIGRASCRERVYVLV